MWNTCLYLEISDFFSKRNSMSVNYFRSGVSIALIIQLGSTSGDHESGESDEEIIRSKFFSKKNLIWFNNFFSSNTHFAKRMTN